jgi:hypothetical protein
MEKMVSNRINLFFFGVDEDPLQRSVPIQEIPKKGQSHDMVQMRMRQQDRYRLGLYQRLEPEYGSPGIKSDPLIGQKKACCMPSLAWVITRGS